MTRYRLYYAPDNASLIVRLALEALGLEYETVLVDRSQRAQKSAEYLKVNPAGLIPALETQDGCIFETGAILLWLSDKHGALAPSPMSPDRGEFLKWLFHVSNTLHANLRMNFYPEQYAEGADARNALRTQAQINISESYDLLENLADENQWWFGSDMPAALDFYVAATLRWCALYPVDNTSWFRLKRWPLLAELAKRLDAKSATAKIATAEGLGQLVFSAPSYPQPPEGSVL